MMMRHYFCLTLLVLLSVHSISNASTRLALEQARFDSLQHSITLLTDSLTRLARQETDQLQQLDLLQRRLNLSQRLLSEATAQVRFLDTELIRIENQQQELEELEQVIRQQYEEAVTRRDTLQQRFRRVVREMYMTVPLPLGEQLLASEDIAGLLRRHTFLRSLNRSVSDRRRQLLQEIERTIMLGDSLSHVIRDLAGLYRSHATNLTYQLELQELQQLQIQEAEQDRFRVQSILAGLEENRRLWEAYLQRRQRAQSTIAQKLALYRQAAANRDSALVGRAEEREYATSRLEQQITQPQVVRGNTIAPGRLQRGQTPWPSQGRISRRFGIQKDRATGASLDNPGIDIRTDGATVEAVAAGRVLEITWLPGFGQTLLLEHAAGYFTVYAGLESVMVTPSQQVARQQQLGRSGDTLHFEIWRERERLDPEEYLTGSH